MQLGQDIRQLVLKAGADLFGIANLVPVHKEILEQWGESIARFPCAISIGIALPDSIIDLLPQQASLDVALKYRQVYDETNQRLDQIASQVVERLQQGGFTTLPVPATLTRTATVVFFRTKWQFIWQVWAGLGKVACSLLLKWDRASGGLLY